MKKIKINIVLVFLIAFSSIAESQEIKSKKDSTSIFDNKQFLNSEVVSPFGKAVDRKYSTTSTSSVTGDDIRSLRQNIGNSLSGKLAGLTTGNGSINDFQIRGIQTFLSGASGIKVVVDGFETDFNNLIPDEIESITVLKDAASLAVYGISGANGVLYIKTKRGQLSNKPMITFNSRVSMQQASILPEFVNNGKYAELYNVAMVSDGKDISNGYFKSQNIVDYYKNGKLPVMYPDVNWQNEILKPAAYGQDYTLAINGGDQNTKYNVVVGYSNTPGLYKGVDGFNNSNLVSEKYVARVNLDAKINSWLRASLNTRAVISADKSPTVSNSAIFSSMSSFLPYNIKTPSGKWGGTEGFPANPVAQIVQQGYQLTNTRTVDADVKVIADIPFIKGLSIFGQVVFSNNYYSYYKKTRGLSYEELSRTTDSTYTVLPLKGNTNPNFSYSQSPGLQWNRYNVLGGAEYSHATTNGKIYASAIYNQEKYTTLIDADTVPWAKVNIFGRLNYTHLNKYVAEFAYSYSGTDNYAPDKRFGFFPAVSGAWIVSNEDFLANNKTFNFLKLRASTGLIGNDQIGSLARFMYIESYGSPNGSYRVGTGLNTSANTIERLQFANLDATWEKAYKTNVGIDAQLFNKLSLSVDYFIENRKDIFVDPSNYLSALIGGRYNYANLGLAKNTGLELELMYKDKIGDFGYFITAKGSYATSTIVDAKEAPRAYEYLYQKGHAIGQPFVFEAIGYFEDQTDITNSPFQSFGAVVAGDVKYKDQNGDNIIDNNDVVAKGYTSVPNIVGSLEAGLEYKGFDLSVFLFGVTQRTVSIGGLLTPFLTNGRKPTEWVANNYWTVERGDAALFPRLTTQSNANNYKNNSDLYQRDGSYLRIKNIELGYSLKFKKGLGLDGLRAYLNAVNPFVFSYITEIQVDPEALSPYGYPVMKSYNIGLTLKF